MVHVGSSELSAATRAYWGRQVLLVRSNLLGSHLELSSERVMATNAPARPPA